MRKLASYLAAGYTGAALMSKELERRGLLHCECPGDCWCHRPGLSLFRWTLPFWHSGRAHGGLP